MIKQTLTPLVHFDSEIFKTLTFGPDFPPGGGGVGGGVDGRVLPEKLGETTLPKTLTLFMTKIRDIPYPTYALIIKSKPCSRPAL